MVPNPAQVCHNAFSGEVPPGMPSSARTAVHRAHPLPPLCAHAQSARRRLLAFMRGPDLPAGTHPVAMGWTRPLHLTAGWLVLLVALVWAWMGPQSTLSAYAGPLPPPALLDGPPEVSAGAPVIAGTPLLQAVLVVEQDGYSPGTSLRAGAWVELAEGWHIYWRSSGDAGLPTELVVSAPGLEIAPLSLPHEALAPVVPDGDPLPARWPAPRVFEEGGGFILTYGYTDRVLLPFLLHVPEDAPDTTILEATLDYLVCEVDCIPGQVTLQRTLHRHEGPLARDAESAAFFDAWIEKIPPRVDAHPTWTIDWAWSHDELPRGREVEVALGITVCAEPSSAEACPPLALDERALLAFIPDASLGVAWEQPTAHPHPSASEGLLVRWVGAATPDHSPSPGALRGLVHLVHGDRPVVVEVNASREWASQDGGVAAQPSPLLAARPTAGTAMGGETPPAPALPRLPWWQALVMAFFGGMLLNLMPCVFPVLAIKAYGFAHLAQASGRAKAEQAVGYSAGIVGSMLLLAAAVIGLRWMGTEVGWGFQFQHPLYIALVGALLVVFALNLFGVFEVGVGQVDVLDRAVQRTHGIRRSLFEGVLAVVLATPCSAPFLGTAVGFALASPPLIILLVFATLGLGLAFPYVLLSSVPAAARLIPRPGPWMETFKNLLGFALLATVLWLLWVLGQTQGVDGLIQVLGFFLVTGMAAWIFGGAQQREGRSRPLGYAMAGAMVVASGGWLLDFPGAAERAPADRLVEGAISWLAWDEAQIPQHLADGRPVFVDFTADWCITCKVNERTVLSSSRVLDAIATHRVVMMKADWTDGNDEIREALARFGKAGVPMYLLYAPGRPQEPTLLPEVITPDMVVRAFAAALPSPPTMEP